MIYSQQHKIAHRGVAALFLLFLVAERSVCQTVESGDNLGSHIGQQIFDSPYVVGVYAVKDEGIGFGTGVVVKTEGRLYILTNNHVIENANEIFVIFSQGHEGIYAVSIVGRDPAADLGLLSAPILPRGIGSVSFGGQLRILEEVYALGYPYGMRSITVGRVNALSTASWLYFLTQTPINPGNSGGPLFNTRHEMVGLNTAIISGATMGFTISVEYVRLILSRLTRERLVEHGAAGFSFDDTLHILPPFFSKYFLPYPPGERGIMVIAIDSDSYAAKSGIRIGDIVMEYNGITIKNALEFEKRIFFDHRPGEEVLLTTKRGAQVFERRIKLGTYISPFAQMKDQNKK